MNVKAYPGYLRSRPENKETQQDCERGHGGFQCKAFEEIENSLDLLVQGRFSISSLRNLNFQVLLLSSVGAPGGNRKAGGAATGRVAPTGAGVPVSAQHPPRLRQPRR